MKKYLILLLFPISAFSQVSMNVSGGYTQDFNTLANAGTNIAWTDNTSISNWFCQKSTAGAVVYDASIGNSNTGKVYSFGAVTDPERALGSVGSAGVGNVAHGILLQNTSTGTISNLTVSYTLEQWRDGGSATPAAQQLRVYYQISNTAITALTPSNNVGWTEVAALMTQSPIFTATASALDGNNPLNQSTLSNISIPGISLNSNQFIMIKWEDPNHAGNDHGLSIDNVAINWIVSCNTTNSFSTINCNTYTVPSGDETYTISGVYMDTIPNAALCDSILTIDVTITTGITYYADTDNDTYGNLANTIVGCTLPLGYVTNSDDCDDTNNAIGIATTVFYADADNDAYGNPLNSIVACSAPIGYVSNNLDCNDADNTINPLAFDIPDNGIDEDCSGSDASAFGTDIGMYEFTQVAACPVTALSVTTQPANAVFSDYSSVGTSCSAAANVFSNSGWNMSAIVDPAEYNEFSVSANDCYTMDLNRIIFTHRISASGGTPTWILRSSLDNYATDLGSGTPIITDKIDTVNLSTAFNAVTQVTFRFYIINMGASGSTWRNDNVRIIGNFGTLTPQTFYADADNDTYGNPLIALTVCTPPVGYVLDNTDCNDANAAINPTSVWYQDADMDTYGNSAVTFVGCAPPTNYVLTAGDCNDADNLILGPTMYWVDMDNDGFGNSAALGVNFCTNPGAGYVTNSSDCNDSQITVYPGATEICDGLDNNCNSIIDDGLTFVDYYTDADNDMYGIGAAISMCQNPGAGYATQNGDCDDANATIYPGATEILDNGIDENCDLTDNYAGINKLDNILYSIHPNPSTGVFNLDFNQTISGTIECIDLNGKVLNSTLINNSIIQLDLSNLSNGTYILRVSTEESISQQRIVIQK